jgi:hypothetical protein
MGQVGHVTHKMAGNDQLTGKKIAPHVAQEMHEI